MYTPVQVILMIVGSNVIMFWENMSGNVYSLKPHFYVVNWGVKGLTFFLFLVQNMDSGYSLEPP